MPEWTLTPTIDLLTTNSVNNLKLYTIEGDCDFTGYCNKKEIIQLRTDGDYYQVEPTPYDSTATRTYTKHNINEGPPPANKYLVRYNYAKVAREEEYLLTQISKANGEVILTYGGNVIEVDVLGDDDVVTGQTLTTTEESTDVVWLVQLSKLPSECSDMVSLPSSACGPHASPRVPLTAFEPTHAWIERSGYWGFTDLQAEGPMVDFDFAADMVVFGMDTTNAGLM
jgi:hypothetical protein